MGGGVVKPFLRWAGGKRWLVEQFAEVFALEYDKFVDPFTGAGSVYFHLMPERSLIRDVNADLIATYVAVRDQPHLVERQTLKWLSTHSRDQYYDLRSRSPTDSVERAARMIYLNRTCFNGIYRVNRQGAFNVPVGDRVWAKYEEGHIIRAGDALRGARIQQGDFADALSSVERNDLVYLDPPFTVRHNNNGFLRYNEKLFSWTDQIRLAEFAVESVERGAKVIVSNACHSSVVDLYHDTKCFDIFRVSRFSAISGRGTIRSSFDELLITSKNIVAHNLIRKGVRIGESA